MRRSILIAIILAAISVAVFHPVTNAEFVHWDDDLNITGNANIRHLDAASLKWMFTDYGFMRRYVPMSWLTWALTYHFFGMNSHVFHAEGLVLHTINILLLFWLLQKILQLAARTDEQRNSIAIPLLSGLGALIWGLHPLRIEVVAWANCQMYAQSLLFLFLSLFCYFRAANKTDTPPEQNPFLWSSVVLFTLSLLSYPTAIGYVAVLLVIDIFLLKRLSFDPRRWGETSNRVPLVEKVPFILVTIAVAGATLWARTHLSDFWKDADHTSHFGVMSRMAQAFYIWAYYLWKPWVSLDVSPVYTQLVSFSPTELRFILSALAIVAGTVLFFMMRRRWPVALALWICHLALLVPMLGLTEHPHYPNDRYNYLSAIVWSVLIAVVLLKIWQDTRLRVAGCAVVVFATGLFAAFSARQTKTWHDSITLFNAVIKKLGNDPYRADLYWRTGRCYAEVGKLDQAFQNYSEALKLSPSSVPVQNSLAELYLAQGNKDAAIQTYENIVKEEPQHSLAQYNLGVLLDGGGKFEEAVEHYRAALKVDPKSAEAHNNLGNDLGKLGKVDEAISEISTSVQLRPDNAQAHVNLANLFLHRNEPKQAIEHYSEAIRLKPESAEAHYMFGTALAMSGRLAEALTQFQETVRINPKVPEGYLAVGKALSHMGQFEEAVKAYRQGLQVGPDFLPIHMNLGWILASHSDAKLRNGEEALKLATHAVELTQGKNAEVFDMLAAAYAETGKFPEAIKAAQQAISLADASGQKDQSTQLQARLQLYQSEHALRQ